MPSRQSAGRTQRHGGQMELNWKGRVDSVAGDDGSGGQGPRHEVLLAMLLTCMSFGRCSGVKVRVTHLCALRVPIL